jgi:hypothetical protein
MVSAALSMRSFRCAMRWRSGPNCLTCSRSHTLRVGLKPRTATNWIQRARAAGYMTSTEHGRAAKRVAAMIMPFWMEYLQEDWKEWLAREGLTGEAIREAFWREHARLAEEEAQD